MITRVRPFLMVLLCLSLSGPVSAQGSHAGRWFQIEVIVFAQQGARAGGHSLPQADTLQKPEDLQFLRASSEATRGSANLARDPMILLPRAERSMNHLARRLENSQGYRVLYHGAWRQPVLLRRDAQPVYLRGGGQVHGVPELEGVVVPSVDIYLATEVDLRLSEPGTGRVLGVSAPTQNDPDWHQQAARMEPEIGDVGYRGGFGQPAERPAIDTVALQEKRGRMRSTELHYFDHPRVGMLIRFDRYAAPPLAPPAQPATETSEPPSTPTSVN